jgi:mannose-6-phosphate isomerase-like protein (cupin superfamily)
MTTPNIDEVLTAWKPYLNSIKDWQALVVGVTPKPTGCGPVYELPNPIERPNESFAIADMRNLEYAEPHYHTHGETEIYIVLTGSGTIVVGYHESQLESGSISITPPDTAHFTIPRENLVLAVINTPPFNAANAIPLTDSNAAVHFDASQLERLKIG